MGNTLKERFSQRMPKVYSAESQEQSQSKTLGFPISIFEISPGDQSRQTFPRKAIERRKRSLLAEGQLEPLELIAQGSLWLIEDGELTWRSARELYDEGYHQFKTLYYVESNNKDPQQIHYRSLLHHEHSESLNDLDRAAAVMRQAQQQFGIDESSAIKLLRNVEYQIRRTPELAAAIANYYQWDNAKEIILQYLNQEQLNLVDLLARVQIELLSFVGNLLPLLDLPSDLKEAVWADKITCSHARTIERLNSKKIPERSADELVQLRLDLVETVTTENLSVADTRVQVAAILEQIGKPKATVTVEVPYKAVKKTISKLSVEGYTKRQLSQIHSLMKDKLAQVEQALYS